MEFIAKQAGRSERKESQGQLYGRPCRHTMSSSPARMTAGNTGNNHVKDGDNAGDDGMKDCANAVDNGH